MHPPWQNIQPINWPLRGRNTQFVNCEPNLNSFIQFILTDEELLWTFDNTAKIKNSCVSVNVSEINSVYVIVGITFYF